MNGFEFSDFCVRSAQWACTRASKLVHACTLCDIQRGSARALLSMWVHAYFFSAICNEHWVLISFGDICLSACPCSCGCTLTIPPPHTLPYYPWTKHPSCALSQLKTIWLWLPSSIIMDVWWRNLRLARGSAKSVRLHAHSYLHHAPSRPHTRPRTLATPLNSTTLHSHVFPTHTPVPHSHLYFGYKLSVWHVLPGLVSEPLRTELTSPQTPIPHTS